MSTKLAESSGSQGWTSHLAEKFYIITVHNSYSLKQPRSPFKGFLDPFSLFPLLLLLLILIVKSVSLLETFFVKFPSYWADKPQHVPIET
jgi:hypothetical protein